MNEKFEGVKTYVKTKAEQVTSSVNTFVERDETKAAVAWTKEAIHTIADEAKELGKRAAHSDMAKDAATGAGIGALVAVPIPLIGPAFGAVVGAVVGIAVNLKSGKGATHSNRSTQIASDIDIHKRLIDLDDLRQKGILTQKEFEVQKKKVLRNLGK